MDSVQDTLAGGFPHSDISGSKLVCQLPEAFRRLPRLSSPVAAKASTVCTYSLDHITPSVLRLSGAGSRMRHAQRLHLNKFTSLSPLPMPAALASGLIFRRKSCVLVQCTNFTTPHCQRTLTRLDAHESTGMQTSHLASARSRAFRMPLDSASLPRERPHGSGSRQIRFPSPTP